MKHSIEAEFTSTEIRTFSHPGISYDKKSNKISLSDDAKNDLQKIVNEIQSQLKIEQEKAESQEAALSQEQLSQDIIITSQTIDSTVDGMVVAGKGKKSIKKFAKRIMDALKKNKKGPQTLESDKKIKEKVQKYSHPKRVEVIMSYSDGEKEISLHDTPITVWVGHDLSTMLASMNTRLQYKQVILMGKKSPH